MAIVLNEREWVEGMLAEKTLGPKPSETFRRLARYYMDQGYTSKEIRVMLDKFLVQCDPSASLPKWAKSLDYAITRAKKYKSIAIDYIDISENEMNKIDSLPTKQLQRLAFTLLFLAKYWSTIAPQSDYWCFTPDNEVMSMANISTSIRRQSLLFRQLYEAGMIQFSKRVDNTNVKVLFAEPGKSVLKVHDTRNLGYQYLKYHNEPYMECQNCGITTKINNPIKGKCQKYCAACAIEIKTKQSVNSVMRIRNKTKK